MSIDRTFECYQTRHLWVCTFPIFTIHFKHDKDERWIQTSQLKAGLYLTYTSILFTLLQPLCAAGERMLYIGSHPEYTDVLKGILPLRKTRACFFFLFDPCFVVTRIHTCTTQHNVDSSTKKVPMEHTGSPYFPVYKFAYFYSQIKGNKYKKKLLFFGTFSFKAFKEKERAPSCVASSYNWGVVCDFMQGNSDIYLLYRQLQYNMYFTGCKPYKDVMIFVLSKKSKDFSFSTGFT